MGTASSPLLHERGAAIRRLRVVSFQKELDRGSHRPALCQLEEPDGTPAGLWVVKPPVSIHATEAREELQVLAEVVGAEVATWCGLATPAMATVIVDDVPEMLFRGRPKTLRDLWAANLGRVAYCSRFLPGAAEWEPGRHREPPHGRDLMAAYGPRIMALDALLLHHDRTAERPNALEWAGRLVVIDHGGAFAQFTEQGAALADVVASTRLVPVVFQSHFCAEALQKQRRPIDLSELVASVASVTATEIDAFAARWPRELARERTRSGHGIMEEMKAFLLARRARAADVVASLKEFLSNG